MCVLGRALSYGRAVSSFSTDTAGDKRVQAALIASEVLLTSGLYDLQRRFFVSCTLPFHVCFCHLLSCVLCHPCLVGKVAAKKSEWQLFV